MPTLVVDNHNDPMYGGFEPSQRSAAKMSEAIDVSHLPETKTCPRCKEEKNLMKHFGTRKMGEKICAQSYCKDCRKGHGNKMRAKRKTVEDGGGTWVDRRRKTTNGAEPAAAEDDEGEKPALSIPDDDEAPALDISKMAYKDVMVLAKEKGITIYDGKKRRPAATVREELIAALA